MSSGPAASAILAPLFADPEVDRLFSDAANAAAMIEVEAALARAEAALGIVPAAAAERIAATCRTFTADLDALGTGTEQSGVPVISLVDQLRRAVGGEAAAFVHWGATSQDIVDTGLVLRLGRAADIYRGRLDKLIDLLIDLVERHRTAVMAGRTRFQLALPITFGLKAAGWLGALARDRRRLDELTPRLLTVQFGGAAGTLAALDRDGVKVMRRLAEELSLGIGGGPWHTARDRIVEFGTWLALVTGTLGKIGQDLVLLAQNEVGEIREAAEGRGGSSTMPQKVNPVTAEMLIAGARMNATLVSALHQAMLQEHERGGPGWQVEWLTLPQMAVLTGGALRQGLALLGRIEIVPARMAANLGPDTGLLLAEAASFALSAHLPRAEAQALVKSACAEVTRTKRHLVDILREKTDAPADWEALRDPTNYLGVASELIDLALAEARAARA